MKKVIISFIAGAILMATGQVFADDISLIGKKVGGEAKVILNGKEISDAIIIDSKSYAPVRDISESFGANVEYEQGVITIDSIIETKSNDEIANINAEIKNREEQVANIERKIAETQQIIDYQVSDEGMIRKLEVLLETPDPIENRQKDKEQKLAYYKASLEEYKAKLVELQAQVDQYNAEIAELESSK